LAIESRSIFRDGAFRLRFSRRLLTESLRNDLDSIAQPSGLSYFVILAKGVGTGP